MIRRDVEDDNSVKFNSHTLLFLCQVYKPDMYPMGVTKNIRKFFFTVENFSKSCLQECCLHLNHQNSELYPNK